MGNEVLEVLQLTKIWFDYEALRIVWVPGFAFGFAGTLHVKGTLRSAVIGIVAGMIPAVGLLLCEAVLTAPAAYAFRWRDSTFVLLMYSVPGLLGGLVGCGVKRYFLGEKIVGWRTSLTAVALVSLVHLISLMTLPAPVSRREPSRRSNCLSNLKQIGIALGMYAEQHGGQLPLEKDAKGLSDLLRSGELTNPKVFICPNDKTRRPAQQSLPLTEDNCSYAYTPTVWHSGSDTNLLPVCWDKPGNHGTAGMNVLFNNGHDTFVTFESWEKIKPVK